MQTIVEVLLGVFIIVVLTLIIVAMLRVRRHDFAIPIRDINAKDRADDLERRVLEMESRLAEESFRDHRHSRGERKTRE
jgi:hypothetical protein